MKIAICDDNKEFLESLHDTLTVCGFATPTQIVKYKSGNELSDHYLNGVKFDLIFLDIEMPGLSGLETAQSIRVLDKDVMIIFLTCHSSYMKNSFKVEPLDYLQKPLVADELHNVLYRAQKKYHDKYRAIKIKYDNKSLTLAVNDIIYIEYQNRYVLFYTNDSNTEPYRCSGKLNEYEAILVPCGFLKCNKSILINMEYIKCIENGKIKTKTGIDVHMSLKKKAHCLKKYSEYIRGYII